MSTKRADAVTAPSVSTLDGRDTLLDALGACLFSKDRRGRYTFVNAPFCQRLGRAREAIIGHDDHQLLDPKEAERIQDQERRVLDLGETLEQEETRTLASSGETRVYWTVRKPMWDARGRIIGLCGVSTDITELQRLREELERRACTDPLTSLANRGHFEQIANHHLARARRSGESLTLLVMDLDHFKRINDTHGHPAGDLVLRGVAAQLQQLVRRCDLVGRIGGEEFAILLPNTAAHAAVVLAERLRQCLSEQRFTLTGGTQLGVTVSIGVAALIPDDTEFEPLFERADQALYRAKAAGRNQVASMQDMHPAHDGASLRLHWKRSFASGQPEIDREHRELFDRANALLEFALADAPIAAVADALERLLNHVIHHFAHEEAILRQHGYADLERHAEQHRLLTERALALRAQVDTGDLSVGELVQFLAVEVVARHMLRDDRAFHAIFAPARAAAS